MFCTGNWANCTPWNHPNSFIFMGIFIKSGILHTLKFHLHTLRCHFWLNLCLSNLQLLETYWSICSCSLSNLQLLETYLSICSCPLSNLQWLETYLSICSCPSSNLQLLETYWSICSCPLSNLQLLETYSSICSGPWVTYNCWKLTQSSVHVPWVTHNCWRLTGASVHVPWVTHNCWTLTAASVHVLWVTYNCWRLTQAFVPSSVHIFHTSLMSWCIHHTECNRHVLFSSPDNQCCKDKKIIIWGLNWKHIPNSVRVQESVYQPLIDQRVTWHSGNNGTLGPPRSENSNISWVWPFHTVIHFMVEYIMPPSILDVENSRSRSWQKSAKI